MCGSDPQCCATAWDESCVSLALMLCPICTADDVCGNGILEDGEDCEPSDFGGETCADFDFDGGQLTCEADCTIATDACIDYEGDCCAAHDEAGCDDTECVDFVCAALPQCCSEWTDECATIANHGCSTCGAMPTHSCCAEGDAPACDDLECAASVCLEAPHCCTASWDIGCAATAHELCDTCEPECGDGIVSGDEVCDGPVTTTCEDLGLPDGTLSCADTCDGFDTSECSGGEGEGDCCSANGSPGCEDPTCTVDVCAADSECCTDDWDDACATEAADSCLACGGTIPGYPCVEEDLGSALGMAIAGGSTVGEDEDLDQSCGGGGAVDRVVMWTAPADGMYTIETVGSDYDTVLSLYFSCDGPELLCDDDSVGTASQLTGALTAGQRVILAVSGDSGATGNWVVSVN